MLIEVWPGTKHKNGNYTDQEEAEDGQNTYDQALIVEADRFRSRIGRGRCCAVSGKAGPESERLRRLLNLRSGAAPHRRHRPGPRYMLVKFASAYPAEFPLRFGRRMTLRADELVFSRIANDRWLGRFKRGKR